MPNTLTLTSLVARVRNRADMVYSTFVSDTEIADYINDSYKAFYDYLINVMGHDYFLSSYNFSTVAGTASYALPSTFYKLRGVDITGNDSIKFTAKPFEFSERNSFANSNVWSSYYPAMYRLEDGYINFIPTPAAVHTITLWYIPLPVTIAAVNPGTFPGPWDTFVILDAAIACKDKEESDVSVLMAQRAELKDAIKKAAHNRDAGAPARIARVRADRWGRL